MLDSQFVIRMKMKTVQKKDRIQVLTLGSHVIGSCVAPPPTTARSMSTTEACE